MRLRSTIPYSSSEIKTEVRGMTLLALPVVLAQLSQMSMGFVDTFMVAKLGPDALGGVGVGNVVYFFYVVFSFGTLAAVNPMVAHAFGAGDEKEIGRSVAQGLWLALFLTVIGFFIIWNAEAILLLGKQEPQVAALAGEYTKAMSWGMIANLWFSVFRGFCDAVNRTRVAMVISFTAIFFNVVADYALIYGELGMPELGAAGAGYATAFVRWVMLLLILIYVFGTKEFRRYRFLYRARIPRPRYLIKMLKLGLPIGATHSMEHGAFGVTSLLMGTISTIALAAHQVSIMLAAIAFMVPMGVSFAITTRVGQNLGRQDPRAAGLAGWVGIGIGTLFMCVTATIFTLIPDQLATIFTDDPPVVAYATSLLALAGAFQISDGIQVLAIGALRGMKDTARPMVINLISYWLIGIPSGWLLAFKAGLGGQGLWWGLVIGLSVAATLHTLRFRKLMRVQETRVESGE
ncbi:MAG: MATE family efflux transporter [Ignavibacteriae bacterium]|nr:MATE family efflux transporter [Ignavibacteriota bacterium]MCB9216578.1 MATE family efflux transporter [Ignavibacteria bacterium]